MARTTATIGTVTFEVDDGGTGGSRRSVEANSDAALTALQSIDTDIAAILTQMTAGNAVSEVDALPITFAFEHVGMSAGSPLGVYVVNHNTSTFETSDADVRNRLDLLLRGNGDLNDSFKGVVASWTDGLNVRAAAPTTPLPVRIYGDLVPIQIQDSFSRPANTTAYAVGDVISNNTSPGAMRQLSSVASSNGGHVRLTKVEALRAVACTIRIYFFSYTNTVNIEADNDPVTLSGLATPTWFRQGFIDLALETFGSSAAYGFADGLALDLYAGAANTSIGYIVTAATAHTPTSGETIYLNFVFERTV